MVRPLHYLRFSGETGNSETDLLVREKGDATKTRDFLPADRQYLVTRGVPCLRRATSLAYTDADEDAERLLSFADSSTPGAEGDEWVETHAGRKASTHQSGQDPEDIAVIPDIDGDDADDVTDGVRSMGLGGGHGGKEPEIIDLDDIPDMEEDDLEGGDEATAAPKAPIAVTPKTVPSGVATPRLVPPSSYLNNGD
jgi:ubiquitin-like-conjugating enzyme ATG3